MFTTLRRPYKERTPEETVRFIRDILDRHNLSPSVTFQANPFPEVFSVSLELPPSQGGFRTNGKGRTREYCLASAYAEFMERLQNGLYLSLSRVLQSQIGREFGFYYAPDESYTSRQDFLALPPLVTEDLVRYPGAGRRDFIGAYFDRLEKRGVPGALAVPFYSTIENRTAVLPLNLLLLSVGSNGMAAGNSREEALFQALCELLERWGAAEVFYRRLTPPSVPDEFLRQYEQEYRIIQAIEAKGKYCITVKDFSAGRGIPAVGVMLENTRQGTYRLNVGCDTCFQVALSRSLTEIFQGFSDEAMIDARLIKIPTENPACFESDDEASRGARYSIFSEFTKDNSGVFPVSLFGSLPSYQFDPATFTPRPNYRDETEKLIAFFHQQGYNVYVRDVSFLGFPSVFVYVPEISALGRKNTEAPALDGRGFTIVEWDQVEERACRLKTLPDEELVETAASLSRLPPYMSFTQMLNLKLRPGSAWPQMPVSFVAAQAWYKTGRMPAALEAFRTFRKGRRDESAYYNVLERYLALRATGMAQPETCRQLNADLAQGETVRQVCEDMADPTQAFRHVPLPRCPDCGECELRPDCLTACQLDMARTLYPIMKQQMPRQGPPLAA